MSRTASRVRRDEVVRLIKAAQSCGLTVRSVEFDGDKVAVKTLEFGDYDKMPVDVPPKQDSPKEVETL